MSPSLVSAGRDLLGFARCIFGQEREHLEAFSIGRPRKEAFGSAESLAPYTKETLNSEGA